MAIECPHCQFAIKIRDAKPGRYSPKCPKCKQRFALQVPTDPDALPVASIQQKSSESGSSAAASTKTMPGGTEETGVWEPAGSGAGSTEATLPPSNTSDASPSAADETAFDLSPSVDRVEPQGSAEPAGSVDETLPPESPPAASKPQSAKTSVGSFEETVAPEADVDATLAAPGAPTMPGRNSEATVAGGTSSSGDSNMPETLGGYRILKELGQGAMGAVYLANQMSLDRQVALKVIQPRWAKDPAFLARFTREAYAAAQLVHHNVVQIYDLGNQKEMHFFSMEFVDGESLSDTVRREGRLDVDLAVSYVLQAARGLKFAHDQGMIHRDVKPDNLLLNNQGVVKVADLGLVKTKGAVESSTAGQSSEALAAARADVTLAQVAMGTPAYMAPEQSEDAANVDHRADIYSLGCTLFVLLTGRPPFSGTTAMEVITKHKMEPMVRPDAVVDRVPSELSEITLKMVAKNPDERYRDLNEVIAALESFLGVATSGSFSPREEHVEVLEKCSAGFYSAPLARVRSAITWGFLGLGSLVVVGSVFFSPAVTLGTAGLLLITTVTYFIVSGWKERTHLFDKTRELLLGSSWGDWLTWLVGGLLLGTALFVLLGISVLLAVSVIGIGLGFACYFLIDRKLHDQRQSDVDELEELLRNLRLRGLEEQSLRQFVCKYSGDRWEELYEQLFGYEAKIAAREAWGRGDRGRRRPKFRSWRDPVVHWIDAKVKAVREAKERKHLEKIEQQGLQATGMTMAEARRKAEQNAAAMVHGAAEIRETMAVGHAEEDPAAKRARIKAMLAAARDGNEPEQKSNQVAAILGMLFGARVRFLLGGVLLAGCLLWLNQNGLLSRETLDELKQLPDGTLSENVTNLLPASKTTEDLKLPLGGLVSGLHAGVAGLILLASSLFPGLRMALFAFPAALVALLGAQLGIPSAGEMVPATWIASGVGILVMGVGLFLGRK